MKKKLAIVGSTGKMGIQALEVVAQHPELFEVEVLAADDNINLLLEQAQKFQPNTIVVHNEEDFNELKQKLSQTDIKYFLGEESLIDVLSWDSVEVVVMATIGFKSLKVTLAAMEAEKVVIIGNKEVLAAAGALIKEKIIEKDLIFIPIWNNISAIYQSLLGEDSSTLQKIILTTPGGPFLDKKPNFLINVKRDHAMQDANLNLEDKTLIDIASLMDAGLELIITQHFFGLGTENLEVVVHPQEAIRAMIEFKDGTIKTLMGLSDLHRSILYALNFPKRYANNFPKFKVKDYSKITLAEPDINTFEALQIALDALEKGGNAPCILNAANEVLVEAFLENKIGFLEMNQMMKQTLEEVAFIEHPTLEDLITTDEESRKFTSGLAKNSQIYN